MAGEHKKTLIEYATGVPVNCPPDNHDNQLPWSCSDHLKKPGNTNLFFIRKTTFAISPDTYLEAQFAHMNLTYKKCSFPKKLPSIMLAEHILCSAGLAVLVGMLIIAHG